jgi:hypothetical protein
MVLMTAVPQRRQTSSLLMILGCLIVYSLFICSHSTQHVTFVTTISDQPTTHKLQAQQTKTVITTTRSQSRTSDRERSARSASDTILQEKTPQARQTISKETEPEQQIDDDIDPVAFSKLKIAIYMTSHLSEKHLKFLHLCWPYASGYLPLLQNSHLILYTSAEPPQDALDRMQFKSVTVRRYVEPSGNETGIDDEALEAVKQMGAKKAMVDPFQKENRWFDGYDWVIRLNPDVLIRRDTWIRQTMLNTSVDGIFVDYSSKQQGRVHSDFYAFRPSAANEKALIDNFHKMPTAETHLYSGFSDSIRRKRVAWLPGARTRRTWARLIGTESPVVHFHPYFKKCPHYFNATYKEIY